jgi:hypothetical protein
MFQKRTMLVLAALVVLSLLSACGGGGPPTPAPAAGGAAAAAVGQPAESVTLAPDEGLTGQAFVGLLSSPTKGAVGLFVHADSSITVVVAGDGSDLQRFSAFLTGELDGKIVKAELLFGTARVSGRNEHGGFDLSITPLGANARGRAEPPTGPVGGVYVGEFNGIPAGLVVLSDGVFYGFAVVEDGESPVVEALCLPDDVDVSTMPGELAATTCETGGEVPLSLLTE